MRMLRRLVRGRDAGTSLVEMMVATSILTLVLALAVETLLLGQRQSGGSAIRLDNTAQSRVAMEALSKAIRTTVLPAQLQDTTCTNCLSTAVISGDATSMTFYGNLNNTGIGPSRISYQVLQDTTNPKLGVLVEKVWRPISLPNNQYTFCDPALVSCKAQTRFIGKGLLWPSPQIFTYYDNGGNTLAALPLAATDLARVDNIDIALKVQVSKAYKTPPTTLYARVALPNADINVPPPTTTPTP
jgi:type II secretory pathway pseudopilin PulG